MDISEVYAKMSRGAWGDDESYVPQVGDYAIRYTETSNRVGLVSMNRDQGVEHLYWHTLDEEDGLRLDAHPISILTRLIPLYRQDQLQEMYQLTTTAHLIAAFNIWLKDAPVDMYLWGSMEQLWLAFVMKEKHGKVWNGEEWDAVLETRKTPRTIPPD